MGGRALVTYSKLLDFYVRLVGWANYNATDQMEDIPAFEKGNLHNRKHITIMLDIIRRA